MIPHPHYDAVSTMETITLIGSVIHGLLKVADRPLRDLLTSVLSSGDDYTSPTKPQIDFDDQLYLDLGRSHRRTYLAPRPSIVSSRGMIKSAIQYLPHGPRLRCKRSSRTPSTS